MEPMPASDAAGWTRVQKVGPYFYPHKSTCGAGYPAGASYELPVYPYPMFIAYTNQTEGWRNARSGCFKTDTQACHVLATSDHCVATSSADSVPALIAHGASVTLASVRGERTVLLSDFYREDGANPTVLAPDELILAVDIPACADRMAFLKVTPREGIDFGLGTIAVAIAGSNRRVQRARIIVNALGSHPMPLREAENIILEQGLNEASIESAAAVARADLGEITNLWTPAGYKRRLVRVLLKRALEDVRKQKWGHASFPHVGEEMRHVPETNSPVDGQRG